MAHGFSFLYNHLKCLQDRFLWQLFLKRVNRCCFAVGFLVVQGKVLDCGTDIV